jgi:DNA-directed RNA polymerase subunit beta
VPESFKVLIKELQSLALDIRVLDANKEEIVIRELDDDDFDMDISSGRSEEKVEEETEETAIAEQDSAADVDMDVDFSMDMLDDFDMDLGDDLGSVDFNDPMDEE